MLFKSPTQKLLNAIYDAALDGSKLGTLMPYLAEFVGAEEVAFVERQTTGVTQIVTAGRFFDPADFPLYQAHYAEDDVNLALLRDTNPGTMVNVDQYVDNDFVAKNRFFQEWQMPRGARHMLSVVLVNRDGVFSGCGFHRRARSGAFGANESRNLGFVIPHMQRLTALQERLGEVEWAHRRSLAALDRLSYGVAVLTRESEVLLMNSAMDKLLGQERGLLLKGGALFAAPDEAGQKLQALAASAVDCLAVGDVSGGGALALRGGELKIVITPLSPPAAYNPKATPAALLFAEDITLRPKLLLSELSSLFSLSPAEARLALDLIGGRSPEEIASARSLSISTVRSHLASLFRKTDTGRQAELLGVLGAIPQIYRDR